MRKTKWEDIAQIIRERIVSGELKPGHDFPTNLELMKEFDAHSGTIQNVVNSLIQEGLVITFNSGNQKRMVRRLIKRTIRKDGFIAEYGDCSHQSILTLREINDGKELPIEVLDFMKPPVLFYKTLQIRDDIPVAISSSFLPHSLPLGNFYDLLYNPKNELYQVMKRLDFTPDHCEESLIVDHADLGECNLFSLSLNNNVVVVRITRKVFDKDGKILEYCLLTDRADAYEFRYNFSF